MLSRRKRRMSGVRPQNQLRQVPTWKAHLLTGNRKGAWSLFVSKNWRLTFRIDKTEIEIIDLNYEDYH